MVVLIVLCFVLNFCAVRTLFLVKFGYLSGKIALQSAYDMFLSIRTCLTASVFGVGVSF